MAKIISTSETKRQGIKMSRLLTVVVVLAVVVLAVLLFQHFVKQPVVDTRGAAPLTKARILENNYNSASNSIKSGDYDGAMTSLETAAGKISDAHDKSFTYVQASSLAYGEAKYQQSYDLAQKAESIFASAASAQMIAAAAAKLGRTSEAIEKYRLAISRTTDQDEAGETDRRSLGKKIIELGGQP